MSRVPQGRLCDDSGLVSARFSNLGVLHVTKKNMMEIMKEKLKQQKIRNKNSLLTGGGSLGLRGVGTCCGVAAAELGWAQGRWV